MSRDYTMDDFRAEMQRRGVYAHQSTRMPARAPEREHCSSCGGTEFVDAIDNEGRPYRGCRHCRIEPPVLETTAKSHGNSIVEVVPCGVHPLHSVKVLASGGRRGCPMCDMQIENVCRSFKSDHSPRISQDRTRIVGCSCGWKTPPGWQDSDDAFALHVATEDP